MTYRRDMRRHRRQMRFRRLRHRALTEGLFGGNKKWMAVGAAVWGLKLVDALVNPKPEVLYRAKLRPGETFTVTEHKPGTYRRG